MSVAVNRCVHVDLQGIYEDDVSENECLLQDIVADTHFLHHARAQNLRGNKLLERWCQPNLCQVADLHASWDLPAA